MDSPRTDAGMTDAQREAVARELRIVSVLLDIEGVRKHETRFEGEVALVAPKGALDAVTRAIEARLGKATKPAGEPTPAALSESPMVKALGGVRGNQTLFHKNLDDGLSVYVAFWPWGSGAQFTVKIGVHYQAV